MKSVKVAIAAAALTAVATVVAPPADAAMQLGNYDLLTNNGTYSFTVEVRDGV